MGLCEFFLGDDSFLDAIDNLLVICNCDSLSTDHVLFYSKPDFVGSNFISPLKNLSS